MSRTYRLSAHTFKKIPDKQNKNNGHGVFKGDWKQDKQIGIVAFSFKKAETIAKEKLKELADGIIV